MSTFEVKVRKITIEPHPDADLIEVGYVDDFQVVVGKGQFKTGDLCVYIPEASIVPDWLIEQMGLVGKLAGSAHNRVKAIRLRNITSQGLCLQLADMTNRNDRLPVDGPYIPGMRYAVIRNQTTANVVSEGAEVADFYGIVKYVPTVPVHMAGEVCNQFGHTLSYDIENIKKYPDIFQEGELVEFTEKIHGTWACFGQYPGLDHPELFEGDTIVTSKGLSDQGLAFKFNENNANNLYVKAFYANFLDGDGESMLTRIRHGMYNADGESMVTRIRHGLYSAGLLDADGELMLTKIRHGMYNAGWLREGDPLYVLGEIFGAGVQDLVYGHSSPVVRIFDVYAGFPGAGRYLDPSERNTIAYDLGIATVPVLYIGPFSKEILYEHTNGMETVSGKSVHIREGVVVTPLIGRRVASIGRVKLKSLSDAYLLRKNKNATEYT